MAEASIDKARSLLTPPDAPGDNPGALLGAAAMAAIAAVLMAGIVVLGPGVQFEDRAAIVGDR
ncbi:MAG: peptidoglycan-binding protein [Brevundimonas sp.]|nr:MAG: peptidoglycan-binding protein [Brevundimonas sp.]